MRIDWQKIRYAKRMQGYLHRAMIPMVFVVDYFNLRSILNRANSGSPERKVVVINLIEHFGDIVACEPVARYVRRTQPDALVCCLVTPPYRELLLYNPNIDVVFDVTCLSEWMLLKRTDLFDEIIDLHVQNKECSICQKPLRKTSGDINITTENYYNYGNLLSAFCQSAGIPVIEDVPIVYIPDETVSRIDSLCLPENFIAVHCSSNEESRGWMQEKWHSLAQRLIQEDNLPIVEVGLQPVLNYSSNQYVNLCGKLSLLETAEVIKRARLFIGIDSGPAHLANATGTYGIILLGEYRIFKHYMPYSGGYKTGENARIIYSDGPASEISVDEVFDSVKAELMKCCI